MADGILSAFDQNQQALSQTVGRLSSGLRVSSAADDPSGLAIADTLQTQALGLDAGQGQVQSANNAVTVADGAMQTVTNILQRMRTLVVEGRSTLLSTADQADLNQELQQLSLEINGIAEKTQFNGRQLLNGSLSSNSFQAAQGIVAQNGTLASGQTLLLANSVTIQPAGSTLDFAVSVDSYDPTTNLLNVTVNIASPNPGQTFDSAYPTTIQIQAGQNYDNGYNTGFGTGIPFPPNPVFQINDGNLNPLINFQLNDLSANDVGQTAFVYTTNTQYATGGAPASVNVGDHEGDTVSLNIPGVSTSTLNINDISVSSNDLVTEGSEYRIDAALSAIGSARSQLGAQAVSLSETANDAAVAAVNLTASQSAIRDLNVAAATTDYTRLQILSQVGLTLLHTAQSSSTILYQILTSNL